MERTGYFEPHSLSHALSLCLAFKTQRLHSFTFTEAVFLQKRQMERQRQTSIPFAPPPPPILNSVKGFITPPVSASPTHTALLNRPVDASPPHTGRFQSLGLNCSSLWTWLMHLNSRENLSQRAASVWIGKDREFVPTRKLVLIIEAYSSWLSVNSTSITLNKLTA